MNLQIRWDMYFAQQQDELGIQSRIQTSRMNVDPTGAEHLKSVDIIRKYLVLIFGWLLFAGCAFQNSQAGESPPTTATVSAAASSYSTPLPSLQAIDLGRLGKGSAADVTWSPDGSALAVASTTGVYFYDPQSWNVTRTIPNDPTQEYSFTPLAFAPDSKSLIFIKRESPLSVSFFRYNIQSGQVAPWFDNLNVDFLSGPALSPDGTTFAFLNRVCKNTANGEQSCSANLELRDAFNGNLLFTLEQDNPDQEGGINTFIYSPDGKYIAAGTADNHVLVWGTTSGKLLYDLQHDSSVSSLAFSPDGSVLASASQDATVRFWDMHTGENRYILRGFTQGLQHVEFLEDGTKLLVGQLGDNLFKEDTLDGYYLPQSLLNISMQIGKTLWEYNGPAGRDTVKVSVSPDKTKMAVVLNKGVQIWDLNTGKLILALPEYNSLINAIAFSPNGDLLAVADHNVELWQVSSHKLIATLPINANKIQDLSFQPGGHLLAEIDETGTLQIWDTISYQKVRESNDEMDWCNSSHIGFSPDGTELAAVGNCGIQIWETTTGRLIQKISGNISDFNLTLKVAFSADGNQLIYVDERGLWRWDLKTGKVIYSVPLPESDYIYSVALESNLMVLGEANDGPFLFFNPLTGQHLYDFAAGRGGIAVALSPNERLLARSDYYNIVLADSTSGTKLLSLDFDMPFFLSFSPDNKLLAAASRSNYVRLWDISSVAALAASMPSATATPLPIVLPTPTETSEPITQLDIQPVAVPKASSGSIGPQNVSQLVKLGQLGRGYILTSAWSPNGKTVAIGVDNGVYTFHQGSEGPSHFFPTNNAIWSLAFSPDGSLLADQSDVVHVWNLSSGQSLFTSEDSPCPFGSLSFSSDGKILQALCAGFKYQWDTSDGHLISKTKTTDYGLSGGPDNKWSIEFRQNGAVLVNTDTNEILQTFDVPGMTPFLERFSPDGKTLLVWFYQYEVARSGVYVPGKDFKSLVQLWNIVPSQLPSLRTTLSTGKWYLILDQLQGPFQGVAFSPDSHRLATASGDGFVQLWDVETGKLLATLPYPPNNRLSVNGSEIFFSADGQKLLAVGSDVQVWDVSMQREPDVIWEIPFSSYDSLLSFTQDGNYLVTSSGGVFDFLPKSGATFLENFQLIQAPNATDMEVVSPNGTWLAYNNSNGGIGLGTTDSKNPNWQTLTTFAINPDDFYASHVVQALTFSPDSSLLASADPDRKILLWHLGAPEPKPIVLASDAYLTNLAFSPNSKLLLGSIGDLSPDDTSMATMYLWDTMIDSLLRKWNANAGQFAFYPDGVKLAIGSYYGSTVQLFDLRKWTLLREYQGVSNLRGLAFNPDGSLLLARCDGKILIWDFTTGKLLKEMDGYFSSAIFSTDGKILALGLGDGTIQFWGAPVK